MEPEKTLYEYVYRMLLHMIYNGKYLHNTELPSLRTLCETYNVGRNTMRTALLKLQEHGFVILEKANPARVCFDLQNFEQKEQYIKMIASSYQLIDDVFTAMEWIMPDIGAACLRAANDEQMQNLAKKINALENIELKSQIDVYEYLCDIYLYVMSFLNNPILSDLFLTMMSSLTLPLVQSDEELEKLAKNFISIKKTIMLSLRFMLKGNELIFRKMIAALCRAIKKIALSYNKRLCTGIENQKQASFFWVSNRSQEYLYMRLVMDIMNDIKMGVYKDGDLLPSLAVLANRYDVSERTSRKAMKVLNEYHIVNTINGLGTKIQINKSTIGDIAKNAEKNVIPGLRQYAYSVELLYMCANALLPHVQKQFTKDTCKILADQLRKQQVFTFEPYFARLFGNANTCLMTIYQELKKPLNWNILSGIVTDDQKTIARIKELQLHFCDELQQRNFHKMRDILYEIMNLRIAMTQQAICICERACR